MDISSDNNSPEQAQITPENGEILKAVNTVSKGKPLSLTDRLTGFRKLVEAGQVHTLEPLLPLLLTLKGNPYTLEDHFPFSPLFRTKMPTNLVVMSGRQVSKCFQITGEEVISAENGLPLKPQQIQIGTKLLALNNNFRQTVCTVQTIHRNDKQKLVRVKTRMGSTFVITPEHPLRTLNGFKAISQIGVGGRVAALRCGGVFNNKEISNDLIKFIAYMIGDGCCIKNSLNFTSASQEVLTEFKSIVTRISGLEPRSQRKKSSIASSVNIRRYPFVEILTENNLLDKYSYEKKVPSWVFDLSREDTALFLSRLWATDGMIKSRCNHLTITYCTTSYDLSRDVRALLIKLGIPASIKKRTAGYKKDGIYHQCRDAYIVRVETKAGQNQFATTIEVPGKPVPVIAITKENSNRDTVPHEVTAWIYELNNTHKAQYGTTLYANKLRLKPKYPPSQRKIDEYVTHFRNRKIESPLLDKLESLVENDIIWDEIISIEDAGEDNTWDIEVDGNHNYILDNIVSHNSTSLAANGVIVSNALPFFSTLYITPLYEQIRRLSNNYIKPFIEQSPVRSLWTGTTTENSVLQRSFKNQSHMYFSYALLDSSRCRGISADRISWDEIQDMDPEHVPIIKETMSHSKWGISWFTGTPKTEDNTIEGLWQRSSQAQWFIKCQACNHWNIPSREFDIINMIGPLRDDISETSPAVVCAKCQRPINPRTGRWVHRYPERRWNFVGYHVPQIIMPIHYSSKKKWAELLGKQRGVGNTTKAQFYNEVLGESYDESTKLVTMAELKAAAIVPWKNKPEDYSEPLKHMGEYVLRVLGVDWGGGGEEETSFTTLAILGWRPDGKIDVLWGRRLLTPHDHIGEAKECLKVFNAFKCSFMAHDYTGAGSLRETFINHAGVPMNKIVPMSYIRAAAGDLMSLHPATRQHPRDFHKLDKARSLQLTCNCIKLKTLRFFEYDYINADEPGLLHDFLALIENKVGTARAGDIYMIIRNQMFKDDFAHAVNLGACALWHATGHWPDIANLSNLQLSVNQLNAAAPPKDMTWREESMGGYMNKI